MAVEARHLAVIPGQYISAWHSYPQFKFGINHVKASGSAAQRTDFRVLSCHVRLALLHCTSHGIGRGLDLPPIMCSGLTHPSSVMFCAEQPDCVIQVVG